MLGLSDIYISSLQKQFFFYCGYTSLNNVTGDEAKGSILAHLKELGLASGLMAGLSYNLPEFSLMGMSVQLTPKGLEEYKTVIRIIYQYINAMKKLTDKDWNNYFIERAKVRAMNFNFKGKEKSYSYSRSLAMIMQKTHIPRKQILESHGALLFEYDYAKISKFLNYLTVNNCYYQLIAKDFEDECKETEKWYNTKYKTEQIADADLKNWRECGLNEDKLFTPIPNPYIADDFTIVCDAEKESQNCEQKDEENIPFVVRETASSKIWFKMDKYFKKPKLCVNVRLYSPNLNDEVLSQSLTDLIILILNDALSDSTYVFEEAALSYSASFNGSSCVIFKFGGYNQKLSKLIETVFDTFKNLKIDREQYENNKEKYNRMIVSMKKSQPYSHCDMIDSLFLTPKSVSLYDLEQAYKQISYENTCNHYAKIFDSLYVESLIYGNIDDKDAMQEYYEIIDKYLVSTDEAKVYSLKEQQESDNNLSILKLPPNKNYCVSFKCPNEEDKNSCISATYLYKMDSVKDFAALKLFSHLINAPCFDQLRTKEQLGYIVWSFPQISKGFMSFRIMIQSNVANPNKLNCRTEEFLNKSFGEFLKNLDDETFELNKKSVINNLLEKPKTIYEQNGKYWREIGRRRYQFEREQNVAKQIDSIKKEDLIAFYNAFIVQGGGGGGAQRTKLIVQCFGNQHDLELKDVSDEDQESRFVDENVINWKIEDVTEVREKCGYYPNPYTETAKL